MLDPNELAARVAHEVSRTYEDLHEGGSKLPAWEQATEEHRAGMIERARTTASGDETTAAGPKDSLMRAAMRAVVAALPKP